MTIRRLYVADDDLGMRELVSLSLESLPDVELTVFDNGLDLLRAVHHAPPDLVVSDIMLPRIEGLAVARLLKFDELLRSIPFLVISSVIDRDIAQQVADVRADDFLRKPFRPAELRERVVKLLQGDGAP